MIATWAVFATIWALLATIGYISETKKDVLPKAAIKTPDVIALPDKDAIAPKPLDEIDEAILAKKAKKMRLSSKKPQKLSWLPPSKMKTSLLQNLPTPRITGI